MKFFTWALFDYDIFIGKARVVADPERTKQYNLTQKKRKENEKDNKSTNRVLNDKNRR